MKDERGVPQAEVHDVSRVARGVPLSGRKMLDDNFEADGDEDRSADLKLADEIFYCHQHGQAFHNGLL